MDKRFVRGFAVCLFRQNTSVDAYLDRFLNLAFHFRFSNASFIMPFSSISLEVVATTSTLCITSGNLHKLNSTFQTATDALLLSLSHPSSIPVILFFANYRFLFRAIIFQLLYLLWVTAHVYSVVVWNWIGNFLQKMLLMSSVFRLPTLFSNHIT